jgi:septum formation protein
VADAPRFILASASPRRQSLLREAGYEFVVEPSNVNEDNVPAGMLPSRAAVYLAGEKAHAVAARFPDDVVLGADTVVAFGDVMLGKPESPDAAREMLKLLSGTTHLVITGVCIVHKAGGYDATAREMSAVRMKFLTPKRIDDYVADGEWRGKAGGYGIQDNDPFVTRLAGSHSNVVGLPMRLTRDLLAGVKIVPTNPPTGAAD